MQNGLIVKGVQRLQHLYEYSPDETFINLSVGFLILDDFLVQVSVIEVIHYDAEARSVVLKECLFVTDNAVMTREERTQRATVLMEGIPSFEPIRMNNRKDQAYWNDANILTSLRAFSFSFTLSFPILT